MTFLRPMMNIEKRCIQMYYRKHRYLSPDEPCTVISHKCGDSLEKTGIQYKRQAYNTKDHLYVGAEESFSRRIFCANRTIRKD